MRADSKLVKIYFGTELIKVHVRQRPGGRSTDVSDYPKEKQAYALRSVDQVLARAHEHGEHIGRYAERLLAGPLPWSRMRAAYALLQLCDKFGDGRVEAACQSALAFDVVDVSRLKRVLATATQPPKKTPSSDGQPVTVTQLPLPRFARDSTDFETRPQSEGSDEEGSP